jgi:hypothetical protein
LPAFQAERAVELQERARDRRADHAGHRGCGHEQADRSRALARREPMRDVQDDAGEETGFRRAQQESQDIKRRCAIDEDHRGGKHAPGEHDSRDPDARAKPRQHQVARHLEQRVAQEKDSRPHSVNGGAEPEIAVHVDRRKADVHAIEIRDDIKHE